CVTSRTSVAQKVLASLASFLVLHRRDGLEVRFRHRLFAELHVALRTLKRRAGLLLLHFKVERAAVFGGRRDVTARAIAAAREHRNSWPLRVGRVDSSELVAILAAQLSMAKPLVAEL